MQLTLDKLANSHCAHDKGDKGSVLPNRGTEDNQDRTHRRKRSREGTLAEAEIRNTQHWANAPMSQSGEQTGPFSPENPRLPYFLC